MRTATAKPASIPPREGVGHRARRMAGLYGDLGKKQLQSSADTLGKCSIENASSHYLPRQQYSANAQRRTNRLDWSAGDRMRKIQYAIGGRRTRMGSRQGAIPCSS